MAKQTFTTGQVLTAAQVNSLQANDFNQTVSVKTAAYVLAAADKGTRIEFNTSGSVTCTVNTGLFDAGDTVIIQNRGAGDVTVTAGTATVNTAGSLVLSQYQSGTLYFISASASIFFAAAVGDLTAVTSGTGISISNAGGPVPTITNSMATEISAKGDLIVGTGSGTFDNLTVGANGTTLVADSGETTGLKWVKRQNLIGCGLYNYYATINSTPTPFAVPYAGSEGWDTDSFHSTTTNTSRITIPTGMGGKYLVTMYGWPETFNSYFIQLLYKNGSDITSSSDIALMGGQMMRKGAQEPATASIVLSLAAGDYVEHVIQQGGTSASYRYVTDFQVTYLGA